jgi:hypothetical protein
MTAAIDDRVAKARALVADLARHGFTPRLDAKGALFIFDTTGRSRDLSRYLAIANVFETLVAGLREDPNPLAPMQSITPSRRGGRQ